MITLPGFLFNKQGYEYKMKYYRLVFRNTERGVSVSEIVENTVDQETFESIVWDKPIIHHNDGKNDHYLAIDQSYLEAMIAGVIAMNNAANLPIS